MPIVSKVKYLRVSPWKVRRYALAFKGKGVEEARAFLAFHPSPTCKSLLKVLNSAVANAENNYELDPSIMIVKNVIVDGGPSYKRYQPVMRGRAYPILKRTSHVTIELDFREDLRKPAKTAKDTSVKQEDKTARAEREISKAVKPKKGIKSVKGKGIEKGHPSVESEKKDEMSAEAKPRRSKRTAKEASGEISGGEIISGIRKGIRKRGKKEEND